jgi:hypothetical protein
MPGARAPIFRLWGAGAPGVQVAARPRRSGAASTPAGQRIHGARRGPSSQAAPRKTPGAEIPRCALMLHAGAAPNGVPRRARCVRATFFRCGGGRFGKRRRGAGWTPLGGQISDLCGERLPVGPRGRAFFRGDRSSLASAGVCGRSSDIRARAPQIGRWEGRPRIRAGARSVAGRHARSLTIRIFERHRCRGGRTCSADRERGDHARAARCHAGGGHNRNARFGAVMAVTRAGLCVEPPSAGRR